MRIDYSEPKQAYVATHGKKQPRKEPAGLVTTIVIITGVITFVAGFGTGWLLSQRSAKKAFQAATQQTSLENSPKESIPVATKPQPPPATAATSQQQPQVGGINAQGAAPGSQTLPEPPLSFYKTLPGGQKGNVMGSGINSKDEKAKQPLQAAIPSNLSKPPQAGTDTAKPVTSKPQAPPEKTTNVFTVQVASYSLKSEAETVKNKLTGKGYNVSIVESNQGDKGIWYRVRVGRKLEQDAAKELAGKLGKGAIVIPDRE
jgi:cell division septation protein DedD